MQVGRLEPLTCQSLALFSMSDWGGLQFASWQVAFMGGSIVVLRNRWSWKAFPGQIYSAIVNNF